MDRVLCFHWRLAQHWSDVTWAMRRLKQPASPLTIIKTKISALLVKARSNAIMSDLVKYLVFYNSVVEHSYFGCVKLLIPTPVTSIVMKNCSLPSFAYFEVVHLWNVQIYKCAIDRVDLQSLLYCSNALKFEIYSTAFPLPVSFMFFYGCQIYIFHVSVFRAESLKYGLQFRHPIQCWHE